MLKERMREERENLLLFIHGLTVNFILLIRRCCIYISNSEKKRKEKKRKEKKIKGRKRIYKNKRNNINQKGRTNT